MATTTTARSLSTSTIVDNVTGLITPAHVRTVFGSVLDAVDVVEGNAATVKKFGAVGNGSTDDTAAFNAALAAADVVVVPEGTYNVTGITIARDGAKLVGMGRGASILRCTSASNPAVTVNTHLTDVAITGLTITRSVTAVDGAYGIRWIASCSHGLIRSCHVKGHYIGLHLCSTDFSTVDDVIVENNVSVGVYMTNNSTNNAVQWSLFNVLSALNGAQGYLVQSTLGPPALTLGTWNTIATFSNGGAGIGVAGQAGCPVFGFRLYNSVLGEDGSHELYLDTYGRDQKISDCMIELAGGVGSGIHITANNGGTQVSNCIITNNARNGIINQGGTVQVTGCRIADNGRAMATFERFGVYTAAGARAVLNGNVIGNLGGTTQQQYGIGFAQDGTHIVNGNDLSGNVTQGLYTGVAIPSAAVTGNIPLSVNV